MERRTASQLRAKVNDIRVRYGADIDVNFYRPDGRTLGRVTSGSGASDISPRLNLSELDVWLDGFVKSYLIFSDSQTDYATLLHSARLLAQLAEGLHANQLAGPIHEDFLMAAKIVRETNERYTGKNAARQSAKGR